MTHGNSKYTDKLAGEICEWIADGKPLAEWCRQNEIGYSTVMDWQRTNKEFSKDIASARAEGHDAIAENLRATARGQGDSTEDVQRDKLIIDTDLKLLAKWSKKYADKVHNEHSGELKLSRIERTVVDVKD